MTIRADSEHYYQHLRQGKRIGVKIFNNTSHQCTIENDIFGINLQKNAFVVYCDPLIIPRQVGGVVFDKYSNWKGSEACIVASYDDAALAMRVSSNKRSSRFTKSKKFTAKLILFDPLELKDKLKRGMKMVSESPTASHGQKNAKWSYQKEEKREALLEITCTCRHCSSEQVGQEEVLQLKAAVLKPVYSDGGKAVAELGEDGKPLQMGEKLFKCLRESGADTGGVYTIEGPVDEHNHATSQLMWLWAVEGNKSLNKYSWVVPIRGGSKDYETLKTTVAIGMNVRERLVAKVLPAALLIFVNCLPSDREMKQIISFPELAKADKLILTTHEGMQPEDMTYELASAPKIVVTSTAIPLNEDSSATTAARDMTQWMEHNVNLNLPEYESLKSSGENVGNPDDLFPFELCLEYLAFQTTKNQIFQFFDSAKAIAEPRKPVDDLETVLDIAVRHKLLTCGSKGQYHYDDERLQMFLAARYAGRMCYKLVLKSRKVEDPKMQMFYKFYAEFFDQFRKEYWGIVRKYSPIQNLSDVPSRATMFNVIVQTASVLKLRVENRVFGIDFTGTYLYGQKKWFLKSARDSLDRGYDSNVSEATITYAMEHL